MSIVTEEPTEVVVDSKQYEKNVLFSEVLHWINERRMEVNMAPLDHLPQGDPGDGTRCVIARGIVAHVSSTAYVRHGTHIDHDLPSRIREFILNFDHMEYPELVKG